MGSCSWDRSASPAEWAVVLWAKGQEFGTHGNTYIPIRSGFESVYVPYTGVYSVVQYFCPNTTTARCNIKSSTQKMQSVNKVNLNSSSPVSDQDPDFGGFSGTLGQSSNSCYAFLDDLGGEWSSDADFMCEDAGSLPATPSACYLNGNTDLNIDMGSLDRDKIPAKPVSGAAVNIKKTIPVLCTRDAGVTVKTTFQFTPLNFDGNEVVSTSTTNLGVAIFYNGKLVGPTSMPITETFEEGYTNRELEFQVVRKSDVKARDIATGNFTANAVMVMTEQ